MRSPKEALSFGAPPSCNTGVNDTISLEDEMTALVLSVEAVTEVRVDLLLEVVGTLDTEPLPVMRGTEVTKERLKPPEMDSVEEARGTVADKDKGEYCPD